MSVLARFRNISSEEYYKVAVDIQKELTSILMNSNYISEQYRPVCTYPTLNLWQEFIDKVACQEEFDYQRYINNMYTRLQYVTQLFFQKKKLPSRIEKVCVMLITEENLLYHRFLSV